LKAKESHDMIAVLDGRARMERATLASIGIHLLAALAIPALAWTTSANASVETISFTRVLHIQIVHPRPPQPRPRAVAPHRSVTPQISYASTVHLITTSPHRKASPAPVIATNAPAAPAVAAVQRAGTTSTNGDAAPDATPSPLARSVASAGTHKTGGYLPFGAEQPNPVLDPNVRRQLDALGVHVTLLVTVGDDGRTQSIVFQPPIDPQAENRIRSLLADANWDPAVCGGGVSCVGQATIKL
jgi:hypothetical protein